MILSSLPIFFGLIILLLASLLLVYYFKKISIGGLATSDNFFSSIPKSYRERYHSLIKILRFITILLVIIALAEPIIPNIKKNLYAQGIDIVIALDVSSSMDIKDLYPNRLEAAIESVKIFIGKRPYDRIGMILFGKDAFVQSPLTIDHHILEYFISKLSKKNLDRNIRSQTAIGESIMLSMIALDAKKELQGNTSKIVILVTDGENTGGEIDPITAAKLANTLAIKVYSIGIGKSSEVQAKIEQNSQSIPFESMMDETTLKSIASLTGGKYFNASSEKDMVDIFLEIDTIEKKSISGKKSLDGVEIHQGFLGVAFLFFILEIMTKVFILRSFPE